MSNGGCLMDKYDYVIAKPEMEEVLYHAGFHKYIDKYLGKNGKWIYKYAGQAKGAATGAINKAKTMLPGLQKQATGAVSTVKKKTSSAMSTGTKTASAVKSQAQKRISSMLPILSKKLNKAKKQARSQAAGVKLVARDKTKKLKKQADGTYSNVKKRLTKTKSKPTMKSSELSRDIKSLNATSGASAARQINRSRKDNYGIYQVHQVKTARQNAKKIKTQDPTKKSVAKYRTKNNGPFPSDWNDLRFKGYSNSMTNAGERGMRTNAGISAGRKRTGYKSKSKKYRGGTAYYDYYVQQRNKKKKK